jgi:uncharacterized membrane protein YdjX (TVP38/TMEM64 family)
MIENSDISDGSPKEGLFNEAHALNVKRSYLKMGAVVLFVALCVVIVHFTPLKEYLTDVRAAKEFLSGTGLWAPLMFLLISAVSIFIGSPRLPFCLLGGMLFGFVQGLALTQIATLAGAYGPYLFARYGTKDWVIKKLKRVDKVERFLKNPTIFKIFLFRQIPIWGVFSNMLLGSINVPHSKFIIGSFLGFLPQAIIFTLIGSGIVEESLLRALSRIWVAIPVLVLGAYLTWRYVYFARHKAEAKKTNA